MNVGFFLIPILIISLVQVAHAQSLSDSINNAVTNDIQSTFDSIGTSNGSGISPSGNESGSQSTTTTTTTTSGPGNSNSTTTTMKTNSQ